MRLKTLVGVGALALATGATAAPVTAENFVMRTTGDMVAICGVSRDDPNATAAIHFCHGYFLGLDHLAEVTGRPFRNTAYCPPEGLKLSRDQVVAMVVDYHLKNPQYASEAPVEGIVRWAAAMWPCKK